MNLKNYIDRCYDSAHDKAAPTLSITKKNDFNIAISFLFKPIKIQPNYHQGIELDFEEVLNCLIDHIDTFKVYMYLLFKDYHGTKSICSYKRKMVHYWLQYPDDIPEFDLFSEEAISSNDIWCDLLEQYMQDPASDLMDQLYAEKLIGFLKSPSDHNERIQAIVDCYINKIQQCVDDSTEYFFHDDFKLLNRIWDSFCIYIGGNESNISTEQWSTILTLLTHKYIDGGVLARLIFYIPEECVEKQVLGLGLEQFVRFYEALPDKEKAYYFALYKQAIPSFIEKYLKEYLDFAAYDFKIHHLFDGKKSSFDLPDSVQNEIYRLSEEMYTIPLQPERFTEGEIKSLIDLIKLSSVEDIDQYVQFIISNLYSKDHLLVNKAIRLLIDLNGYYSDKMKLNIERAIVHCSLLFHPYKYINIHTAELLSDLNSSLTYNSSLEAFLLKSIKDKEYVGAKATIGLFFQRIELLSATQISFLFEIWLDDFKDYKYNGNFHAFKPFSKIISKLTCDQRETFFNVLFDNINKHHPKSGIHDFIDFLHDVMQILFDYQNKKDALKLLVHAVLLDTNHVLFKLIYQHKNPFLDRRSMLSELFETASLMDKLDKKFYVNISNQIKVMIDTVDQHYIYNLAIYIVDTITQTSKHFDWKLLDILSSLIPYLDNKKCELLYEKVIVCTCSLNKYYTRLFWDCMAKIVNTLCTNGVFRFKDNFFKLSYEYLGIQGYDFCHEIIFRILNDIILNDASFELSKKQSFIIDLITTISKKKSSFIIYDFTHGFLFNIDLFPKDIINSIVYFLLDNIELGNDDVFNYFLRILSYFVPYLTSLQQVKYIAILTQYFKDNDDLKYFNLAVLPLSNIIDKSNIEHYLALLELCSIKTKGHYYDDLYKCYASLSENLSDEQLSLYMTRLLSLRHISISSCFPIFTLIKNYMIREADIDVKMKIIDLVIREFFSGLYDDLVVETTLKFLSEYAPLTLEENSSFIFKKYIMKCPKLITSILHREHLCKIMLNYVNERLDVDGCYYELLPIKYILESRLQRFSLSDQPSVVSLRGAI